MGLSGWEAFTHGVFAIAETLLVLDIRVPDAATIDSGAALVSALAEEFPHYLAYVFGFLFVGTYWIATHRIMGWMRGVDHFGLVLGLLYLMVISAVPFVTALLAEYVGLDNGRDRVGLVVFASWQLILSILAIATFRYAAHGGRLLKPTIDEEVLRDVFPLCHLRSNNLDHRDLDRHLRRRHADADPDGGRSRHLPRCRATCASQ